MTRPQYTRYTLRLSPAAAGGTAPASSAPAPAPAEPYDDWSGAAAYARGPDPEALDYVDPEAVRLIGALQPAGWEELDDIDGLLARTRGGLRPRAVIGRRHAAVALEG